MSDPEDTPSPSKSASPNARWEVAKVAVTVILIVGLCVWFYLDALRPRLFAKNFDLVEPGLYRSGQVSRHLIGPTLRGHGIDAIVNMNAEPGDPEEAAEIRAAEALGVDRRTFNLRGDGTGDPRMYVEGLTMLVKARRAGKTVLVHCSAGSERTSGVIGLYRVLFEGWKPADAVPEMLAHKHDPRRNPDLLPYLNDHVGEIARGLVEAGVLERVPEPLPVFPVGGR